MDITIQRKKGMLAAPMVRRSRWQFCLMERSSDAWKRVKHYL
ncbi:hypothetical protein VRB78_12030 [Pseudomonas trivialis]|jgi:hypothetical protein